MRRSSPDGSSWKRAKIFTVHGTFDHAAPWDNWDKADSPDKPAKERNFVNRLSEKLAEHNVAFEHADHVEYNWSGGNSHDERRTAAIGLKKRIQDDLVTVRQKFGKDYKDYYDGGVYIIGHSHGGTISRMAMNMWDKGDEYYDPDITHSHSLMHNDKCDVCRVSRNGPVGPNTIDRPNGVITFGSPFVHFKERKSGLLAARFMAWGLMGMGLVAIIAYYIFAYISEQMYSSPFDFDALETPLALTVQRVLGPLFVFWLLAMYIPSRITAWVEKIFGKNYGALFMTSTIMFVIKVAGAAVLATLFYLMFFQDAKTAFAWLDRISGGSYGVMYLWMPLVLYWLLAISLPGRFLKWMRNEVDDLRTGLPSKYDPPEDPNANVKYLSYSTFGDEAGLHLRIFGLITWLVQTLLLTAGTVVVGGLAVLGLILLMWTTGFSISPAVMIPAVDTLTLFPALIWNWVFGWFTTDHFTSLGNLPNATEAAKNVPGMLAIVSAIVLLGIMPIVIVLAIGAYALSMWLRGSGLVFGSERFTWTVANNIKAGTVPSPNTQLKKMMIAPEAWWNMEMAHCFFYKSEKVITDVADHIADWAKVTPNYALNYEDIIASSLKWIVAVFAALSMLMAAVTMAGEGFTSTTPTEPPTENSAPGQ